MVCMLGSMQGPVQSDPGTMLGSMEGPVQSWTLRLVLDLAWSLQVFLSHIHPPNP